MISFLLKKTRLNKGLLLSMMAGMFLFSCKDKPEYPGPLSPEESMKTFQFAEDFKAEIYATEPLVIDPVSMNFDEQGNAYVVGMLDAYKPDEDKGRGKIMMLKDLNGDGRADTSIVFADSLREATSVLPWNGGLLIAAAPNIMFYKDTDGDGRADHKEILFTGFFSKNEEAQITNLRFGIDNWIYANNTGQTGEITFTRKPGVPELIMQGADFRFRLDKNLFERSTGPGQFGLAIDNWGHRFFTNNSLHIRQVVIPLRYLERNPYLPGNAKIAIHNISDHDPVMFQLSETPHWRQVRTDRRNKEYQENNLDRVEYARDHFTGASGGTFYGGDALPEKYYGNIFTGEVAGNLVHRDVLSPSGSDPFMVAQRGTNEKEKEFLAATDTWFRPASLATAPDGHLYVIDMYRQHIETPMSIPEDLQEDMDFDAGNKYGRIYRLVPSNAGPYKKVNHDLRKATANELVEFLSNNNQFWRLQAQRLLLERQDKSVIPAVKALFSKSSDARARLHALYVLEGLDALEPAIVNAAMKDASPGVRENAAILSERFPECLALLKEMVNDSSIRVAFQATLSLGHSRDNSVIPVFVKVLEKHGESSWFRSAVLSAEKGSGVEILKALKNLQVFEDTASWKVSFVGTLANIVGARNENVKTSEFLNVVETSFDAGDSLLKIASVKGLVKGLERSEDANDAFKERLKSINTSIEKDVQSAIEELKQIASK